VSDRYFKTGKHRGYMWCVRRTEAGTVCCYVNVSQNAALRDIWFRGADSEADDIIQLHGGMTYFTKGVPHDGRVIWADDIVVGCDYGHYGDTLMSSQSPSVGMLDPTLWMTSSISEAAAESETKGAIDALLLGADA